MDLYVAIEKLYDVLALDRSIAKEILKDLVEDEDVCFILSIDSHFSHTIHIPISREGMNANIEYQLGQVLTNLSVSNNAFLSHFSTLDIKTQVVLKELLSASNKFDSTIFYGFATKVFSRREILEYLQPTDALSDKIPYIISDSPKYYYVSRTGSITHTNTPRSFKHTPPFPMYTFMYDKDGATIAKGQGSFGKYLRGKGMLPEIEGQFKYGKSLVDIQYRLNKTLGNKFALVFHTEGIITLKKESLKFTCGIIDFILSDDFEVIGVWIEHKGNTYEIKTDVPQTMVDRGLHKYVVNIKANELVNEKLNNIEFVQFNLKETNEYK